MKHKLKDGALVMEPRKVYDDAIIRVDKGLPVYSIEKVIECGIKIYGSWEESLEWHDYNTFNSYMGKNTPEFVSEMNDEDFGTK